MNSPATYYARKPSNPYLLKVLAKDDAKRGMVLFRSSSYATKMHSATPFPADPKWDEDPFNDRNWLFRYHGFEWLEQLCAASAINNEPRCLKRGADLVLDWQEDVYGRMPCDTLIWTDHTVAERLRRLVHFFELYRKQDPSEETLVRLLQLIYAHADLCANEAFYARNQPMRIHNHGFFQDHAILHTALMIPEFKDARQWQQVALSRMREYLAASLTDEGILKENTSTYHIGMMNVVHSVNEMLRAFNQPESLAGTEQRMLEFSEVLLRPDGYVASFGDNARPVASNILSANPMVNEFLGSLGQRGTPPAWKDKVYSKSGYAILRDRWWPADRFEMGVFTLITAAFNSITHKHRDDLAVAIYGYGEDWLVDAGLYKYDETDPLQKYARSARAHNTVSIDQTDFPITESLVGSTTITRYQLTDLAVYVEAQTKAYESVEFTRRLFYLRPNIWLVEDVLIDRKGREHDFTQHFHFPPDKKVERIEKGLKITGTNDTEMIILDLCRQPGPTLHCGESTPAVQGWLFPQYGQVVSNYCANYQIRGSSGHFIKLLVLKGNDPFARRRYGETPQEIKRYLQQELPSSIGKHLPWKRSETRKTGLKN